MDLKKKEQQDRMGLSVIISRSASGSSAGEQGHDAPCIYILPQLETTTCKFSPRVDGDLSIGLTDSLFRPCSMRYDFILGRE